MDLLVDLYSQYHLNPAYYTLELLSPNAQPVSFKPNTLLGALDVSCALIKERVLEDKLITQSARGKFQKRGVIEVFDLKPQADIFLKIFKF